MNNSILDGYIFDIICHHKIKEQKELKDILKKNGHDIPQATLSRRLKKLKIVKIEGIYQVIHSSQKNYPMILNMHISESGIFVLHTLPGQASSLAAFLDNKYVDYSCNKKSSNIILGTIAGDDTVLIVIKNIELIQEVLNILYKDFPYLQQYAK